ncbi:hypothetical protein T4E_2022 [Trichinella pseudospiralis]|uniref:Uncharacterized protein n=1 Tax=Trichinella pseudospiralis TaxID=6337 RepID=A0A0V0YHP4_TRIPS|nr:hypothetical protein T4E_2022 [Trichinella pseudospiralis]
MEQRKSENAGNMKQNKRKQQAQRVDEHFAMHRHLKPFSEKITFDELNGVVLMRIAVHMWQWMCNKKIDEIVNAKPGDTVIYSQAKGRSSAGDHHVESLNN